VTTTWKRRFAGSLGTQASLATKKPIGTQIQPAKVMETQSGSRLSSQLGIEQGESPNDEQQQKHSDGASGVASTIGTGAGLVNGKPAPNPNEKQKSLAMR
jgi:hypothetical protein